MNKQELKEVLSLYLPYDIDFKAFEDGKTYQLNSLSSSVADRFPKQYKLLLHPLSKVDDDLLCSIIDDPIQRDTIFELREYLEDTEDYGSLSVCEVFMLAEYHIDFANLIEKGYAIEKEVESE